MRDLTPFDMLARCPLFAELADDDIEALAEIAIELHYDMGEMLFFAGDDPEGLGIVARGKVRVYVVSPESGREVVLTMEHPFHAVAELPSFDGGPYPANAQAVEATDILLLPREALEGVLGQRPTLSRHLLRTLGRRLRRLVGLVEQISFQEVIHRLARYLLDRAHQGVPFELETNASIGAQIGTVPELVSRNLSRLAQGGVLRLDGRTVVEVDERELQELARSAGR